jgi:hypothetical protein
MSEYFCRKINCQVTAEKSYDITGRVFVGCEFYTFPNTGQFEFPCKKDYPRFKKCRPVGLELKETLEKSELVKESK